MTNVTDRVKAIIDEQGEDVLYKKKLSTGRTTATLKKAVTFTVGITIRASIRDYKDRELSGLVQQGDREVHIAADAIDFTPEENDKITVQGVVFNVASVDIVKNRNVDAIYILRIRGKNPQSGV